VKKKFAAAAERLVGCRRQDQNPLACHHSGDWSARCERYEQTTADHKEKGQIK